jgi:hypothetical protein
MQEARPARSPDDPSAFASEAMTALRWSSQTDRVRRRVRERIKESERRMASATERVVATRARIESALRTAAEAEDRMARSEQPDHQGWPDDPPGVT